MTKESVQEVISKQIKQNTNFIDRIDQELHNEGIDFDLRCNFVTSVLYDKSITFNEDLQSKIKDILQNTNVNKNEIFQIVYMHFGSKYFKKEFDQFYTPITICNFIQSIMLEDKEAIDPACGTGDLLNYYNGNITLCDKGKDVISITKFISQTLNNNSNIINEDSLIYFLDKEKQYNYCVLNPPFGSKTIITDKSTLNKYELGKKLKKQEIGILFIELGLKLLKQDGVLFVIVPNGYLGNCTQSHIDLRSYIIEHFRLIGIIKLPDNAFSRSGTGVSTSIMIISNTKMEGDYNIFIEEANDIGYQLNKKNTPLKYKTDQLGYYEYIDDKTPILKDDLDNYVINKLKQFAFDEHIENLNQKNNKITEYTTIKRSDLGENLMFDTRRYLPIYREIRSTLQSKKFLKDYCKNTKFNFQKQSYPLFKYIAIGNVSSPLYTMEEYNYIELPSRAKYMVKPDDIIISKLKGKISFCIISHNMKNLVVSSGFYVCRPKDEKSKIIIFGNLCENNFKIQHQSRVTGSIMETISDKDIENILINDNINFKKYKSIIESIELLNVELQH